ncbi:DUF551 domain-containing protein [Escherichia coli]|uniref:DUF551 domain-containing protein n=1 Tax=Escherichia coli TaxID=562 RepID=UPI0024073178|nr:DUF551 domain-containing protein [Escherichia coli]MCJ2769380.1 DUF551 domain-containing protein [Escherichia coli]MDF9310036.1 DUF551 domain-containing protein [Escherichia coli]MDF9314708.1 DUF551 domain-containing protein [Escherichia coli]
MDNRYEIAEQNGMSLEFADWFFDNKKDGCGNAWFVMMAAMWEGWKGRAEPPVPDKIALAIENLKQKLVECNRYNYCADAVKGVEDACRAVSYSQADNQPASGNQAAESNRGNEWTGNPDIDNAIIMLDRIDTLENCDDDRIEAVKAVLRRLDGNSPVIPDGWISCSELMPEDTKMLLAFSQGEIVAAYWNWVVNPIDYKKYRAFTYLSGNILDDVTHWMPLPEPPL